jgi:hypothetical protein
VPELGGPVRINGGKVRGPWARFTATGRELEQDLDLNQELEQDLDLNQELGGVR